MCIPFLGIARPQFPHSCVCERFIYSQDRSTYFLHQNRKIDRGNRREIITLRGQFYVLRFQNIDPPPPSPPGECAFVAGGGHTRRVEKGVGGQYFGRRKTQLCTLPISNLLWWEYINRSQAHECGSWPFLGIFVSNFLYWFFAVCRTVTEKSRRGKMMGRVELLTQTVETQEYTKCPAFSPVVRIGSPRPLTRKVVLPPPPVLREGQTRLRERGWVEQIRTKGQILWYFRYCTYIPSTIKSEQDKNPNLSMAPSQQL